MKIALIVAIILIALVSAYYLSSRGSPNAFNQNISNPIMTLSSSAFSPNQKIPSKFTCDGGNINPELVIQNVPPEAKSLALIVDDPDAPMGTFTHWLVWNINPKTEKIKQESVPPEATEGLNDRQKVGYTGPCPPDGKPHRYFFKLYALGSTIDLQPSATKKELEAAIEIHLIEKAELIGIYER